MAREKHRTTKSASRPTKVPKASKDAARVSVAVRTGKVPVRQAREVEVVKPTVSKAFAGAASIAPPRLAARATASHDGRTVPVVLATVRTPSGDTPAGVLVRLVVDGEVVDQARTDRGGAVLLRFSNEHAHDHTGHGHAHDAPKTKRSASAERRGVLEIVSNGKTRRMDVVIGGGRLSKFVDAEVEEGPRVVHASTPYAATGNGPLGAIEAAAARSILDNLPVDFSTDLCEDLRKLRQAMAEQDPLLSALAGKRGFTNFRMPIVRRIAVPRLGQPGKDPITSALSARRYVVRLRQDWAFLGYSLGEVKDLVPLDPGAVLDQTRRDVFRAADRLSNALNVTDLAATQSLDAASRTRARLDARVDLSGATSSRLTVGGLAPPPEAFEEAGRVAGTVGGAGAGAAIGAGIGGAIAGSPGAAVGAGIGGLIGGALGGEAGAAAGASAGEVLGDREDPYVQLTNAFASTLHSTADTSVEVNASLRAAQRLVNRVTASSTDRRQDVERVLATATNRVSPLLSRVTNLLRWTVHENYAVCTHVEDVLQVREVPFADLGGIDDALWASPDGAAGAGAPLQQLFRDEHIVEFERFFAPRLLDPALRGNFARLRRALALRRSADLPVSVVRVNVHYRAPTVGGELRLLSAADPYLNFNVTLQPGGSFATAFVRFPEGKDPATLGFVDATLLQRDDLAPAGMSEEDRARSRVAVIALEFEYEAGPGLPMGTQRFNLGAGFEALPPGQTAFAHLPLEVPVVGDVTSEDPLVVHVNRNRTHYFGLLFRAALREPSLRADLPFFRDMGLVPEHLVWRLPIVGIEGARLLVLGEPASDDPDAAALEADVGAATLVQVAAPGAYAEALQGLLQLEDAAGLLHPLLTQVPGLGADTVVQKLDEIRALLAAPLQTAGLGDANASLDEIEARLNQLTGLLQASPGADDVVARLDQVIGLLQGLRAVSPVPP